MKNITYLFIVAVVFLCSCKSSSFLNQRYTHFGHGHAKKQQQDIAVSGLQQKTLRVTEQAVPAAEQVRIETPQSVTAAMPAVQLPETCDQQQTTALQKVKRALAGPVAAAKAKAAFQQKKTDAGASQSSFKGLITGLIGLVLYIVLSALVIAAIIILVLMII